MLLAGCAAGQVSPQVEQPFVEDAAEPVIEAVPPDAPTAMPAIDSTPPIAADEIYPPHPLMIEEMRKQEYPGSELVFEQTLEPGANYDRYIVSYLSEGNRIYAMLTVPQSEIPLTGWPVIIFNHGYMPPSVYRTTERYVAYVDGFARNGYIVFKSDYRGHGFSEGVASGGYSSPAYTVDVLNGMAAVKNYTAVDPNRIGMWGHSMGGQITIRSMVVSNEIKAGVIWGGVVSTYPEMYEYWWGRRDDDDDDGFSSRGGWRNSLYQTYGTPEENPAFWASISPNTYVSDLTGPVQLHHGGADADVPVILSELLLEDIRAAGLPAELFVYDGDDHDITASFNTAMRRSVEFFDIHVKGQAVVR